MQTKHPILALMAMGLLANFIAGCAGTAGTARPLTEATKPEILTRYTKLAIATSAQGDASTMTAADRERIAALVAQKVNVLAPNRFADVAAATPDSETLQATIAFTRYDQGNAFARFMLAGLGQIHIDADVTLEDRVLQTVLGKFKVTKTFAWGGIYGGATRINDVEEGFAEAVAKVVLGQPAE